MQYLYISYPEHDYDFAHRLVDDLQAEGYVVFVDTVTDAGTMAWAAETRHAIRSAGAVLMILDPARGRRVGMRHEGIVANRGRKPTFVLLRSEGSLPRYLTRATVINFAGPYEQGLKQLLSLLPDAAALLTAPDNRSRRTPRRPPRPPKPGIRRWLWRGVLLAGVLVACLAAGIALGVISL